MSIRVQPAEVTISDDPDGNPFKHDLLDRKESIEALTTLLGNVSGPCVIAVDASWGMGKTTFLRMWAQHLRNQGFPVAEFNAWETDYANQPFVALISEVTQALNSLLENRKRSQVKRLTEATGRVLTGLSSPSVRLAASAVPLVGNQLVAELDRDPSTLAEAMTADYTNMKEAMRDFRTHLEQEATDAASLAGGYPLVVLIDELDRCRPNYAIELLETAKHFFTVDHVVFVLCLDRRQLAHSIKAVYGDGFAADGYLRRFFDIDLRLENPDRRRFINAAISSSGLYQHLQGRNDYQSDSWFSDPEAMVGILSLPILSLRDALQVLHRLGVIISTIPHDRLVFAEALSVLLTLRTVDIDMYRGVLAGTVKDEQAVFRLLEGRTESRLPIDKVRIAVEATVAASICIATRDSERMPDKTMLPLVKRYHQMANAKTDDRQVNLLAKEHALLVLNTMSRLFDPQNIRYNYDLGAVRDSETRALNEVRRRLELFPSQAAR